MKNMKNMDNLYNQFNRLRPTKKGTIKNSGAKLKPNQQCPCGSGNKYKRCCQNVLETMARLRGSNIVSEKEFEK